MDHEHNCDFSSCVIDKLMGESYLTIGILGIVNGTDETSWIARCCEGRCNGSIRYLWDGEGYQISARRVTDMHRSVNRSVDSVGVCTRRAHPRLDVSNV